LQALHKSVHYDSPWGERRFLKQHRRKVSKNIKIRIFETIILPVVLYGSKTWVSAIYGGT
jgi:hypothetical protein